MAKIKPDKLNLFLGFNVLNVLIGVLLIIFVDFISRYIQSLFNVMHETIIFKIAVIIIGFGSVLVGATNSFKIIKYKSRIISLVDET